MSTPRLHSVQSTGASQGVKANRAYNDPKAGQDHVQLRHESSRG